MPAKPPKTPARPPQPVARPLPTYARPAPQPVVARKARGEWEYVNRDTERMAVPGGWLYRVAYFDEDDHAEACALQFVPHVMVRASVD